MKRLFGAVMAAVLMGAGAVQAQEGFSRVKLSLVPPVATSDAPLVSGLDFGLLATRTERLEGVQLGIFYAGLTGESYGAQAGLYAKSGDFYGEKWGLVAVADDVKGLNSGIVALCRDIIGYESGWYCQARSIKGMQAGLVNVAQRVSGFQLGLVNYTETMNGVQVGLLNIITKSSLPAMIVLNYKFE